jgi:hypothetical protein
MYPSQKPSAAQAVTGADFQAGRQERLRATRIARSGIFPSEVAGHDDVREVPAVAAQRRE